MVLVDTSVWIRFMAGRLAHVEDLRSLLSRENVAGHPLVYGELLIGDIEDRVKFLAEYSRIIQATTVHHDEVVRFVRNRQLPGRGIGWIDVNLLASAIVDGLRLWTADTRLSNIAIELGVAYIPEL